MSLMEESTVEQLTFSQQGFHASHSVWPASKEARTMIAISGLKCLESSERLGHVGLLAKTLLGSSSWHSTKCFLTWKLRGTPQKRLLFQLVPSMPRTGGTESGLLPTMRAGLTGDITEKRKHDKHRNLEKAMAIVLLRTPSAMEIREKANARYKLRDQIALLPAPPANTEKNTSMGINFDKREKKGYVDGIFMNRLGKKHGLTLRPNFVEWMMGFPDNWTELTDSKPSEMQSSPKLPTRSSSQLKKRSGFGD